MAVLPTVIHVGPDVRTTGGMATVIGLLSTSSTTGDFRVTHAATWAPGSRSKGLVPAARLGLRLALARHDRPAWLHAHLSEGGSFVREGLLLRLARALGIRTAATLHGAEFLEFSTRHPRLVRGVLDSCSVVFALGPHAAERVRVLCPGVTVRSVLNPVDLRELDGLPTPEHRVSVLFGGEVGLRKGIDRLAAAWPEVRRAHPSATCLVCGPQGDFPADALPDGMTYLGPVPRARLLSLLKATDVACLPSRDEALPMFVLESLGVGVPVVTTPVGELDQLGEAQGVALTNGDAAHIAALLIQFLDDPDRRTEWGRRASEWARERCSADSVRRELESAYSEELVAR